MSILQHPDGAAAPAPLNQNAERGDHPLGLVPHQIRGFLSTFSNISVAGRSYDCCSACSDKIVDAYRKDGWDFVQKAINDKEYVEELSGLKEVRLQFVNLFFCSHTDSLTGTAKSRGECC